MDKTPWAYDPHLDPVLKFDSARAGIEKLIEMARTIWAMSVRQENYRDPAMAA